MDKDLEVVIAILEQSNIVWPKYGTESCESLAKKIVEALKK